MEDEIDIRVTIISRTFSDIAGIPLREDDDIDPVSIQKLQEGVRQHLGLDEHDVIPPRLLPHESGALRFPRYEVMVGIIGRERAVILYTDELPEDLQRRIVDALPMLDCTTRR